MKRDEIAKAEEQISKVKEQQEQMEL